VTAVSPEIVRRQAPVKGWYLAAPACGAEPVWAARINFDAPRPRVGYWTADGSSVKHLALAVTRTDPAQMELWASTRKAMLDWRATIFYSAANGDGSLTVDDQGNPFQVSTETDSDGYSLGDSNATHLVVVRRHDWDKRGIPPGC
jgi:hypothetical protein